MLCHAFRKILLHKPVKRDDEKGALDLPGVTIAKPLTTFTDPNLVDNLTTYFKLDYPTVGTFLLMYFKLMFLVQRSC